MKKLISITALFVLFLTCIQIHSASAASNSLNLNIDGRNVTGENPKIIEGTTFVPIRTVSLLPNFFVNWNNTTKTVTVTNQSENKKVALVVGQKVATVDGKQVTLSTPVRLMSGTTYVPFRFIGESLDAEVSWDQPTKSVVIYTTDEKVMTAYESQNLVTSRTAALKLTRIQLNKGFSTSDEGHSTGYYFPTGKSNQFFITDRGIVKYYVVKNKAAWKVWEATQGASTTKPLIPGIIESADQEWGTRPTYKGTFSYFADLWMEAKLNYGLLDTAGNTKQVGSDTSTPGGSVVREIPADNVKK